MTSAIYAQETKQNKIEIYGYSHADNHLDTVIPWLQSSSNEEIRKFDYNDVLKAGALLPMTEFIELCEYCGPSYVFLLRSGWEYSENYGKTFKSISGENFGAIK
jgi:hypothetical protein